MVDSATLLQQARHWMIGGPVGGASPATLMGGRVWLLVPAGIALGLLALGLWVFQRAAPHIAEELWLSFGNVQSGPQTPWPGVSLRVAA